MAKILKKPHENPKIWKIEETCTGKNWIQKKGSYPCFHLIEVMACDIRSITYNGDTYYGFDCPLCCCFTELNKDEIPDYVKYAARRYSKSLKRYPGLE